MSIERIGGLHDIGCNISFESISLSLKRPAGGKRGNSGFFVWVDLPPQKHIARLRYSWFENALAAVELLAPGKKTTAALNAFAAHPLVPSRPDLPIQEVLKTGAQHNRTSHRVTPEGKEYFTWRTFYAMRTPAEVIAVWRFRVSWTLPSWRRQKEAQSWEAQCPVLAIALINAWDLVSANVDTDPPLWAHLGSLLESAVVALAEEAASRLADALAEAELDFVNTPFILEVARAPQASHHDRVLKALTVDFLLEEPSWEHDLDIDPLVLQRCIFKGLSTEEAVALEDTAAQSVIPPTHRDPIGATYIFLQRDCPEVLLTPAGRVVHAGLLNRYNDFLEEYRCSPKELLKAFRCDTAEYSAFEPPPKSGWYGKALSWLQLHFPDVYEDPFDLHALAEGLTRAPHQFGGFPASVGLILRVLVDQATGVSYARLCQPAEPVELFLQHALAGGIGSPLVPPVSQLMVAKTLVRALPSIATWCDSNQVCLVAPESGFKGGVHHLKRWIAAIHSMELHRKTLKGNADYSELKLRTQADLPTLAEMQVMLETQSWILALPSLTHRTLWFGSGYAWPQDSVRGDDYFKHMRPTESPAELLKTRAARL